MLKRNVLVGPVRVFRTEPSDPFTIEINQQLAITASQEGLLTGFSGPILQIIDADDEPNIEQDEVNGYGVSHTNVLVESCGPLNVESRQLKTELAARNWRLHFFDESQMVRPKGRYPIIAARG